MITHNGYYQISPPNQTVWSLLIFLTALMRGIPPGFSQRWALLTYLQTAKTTVDDQFVFSGSVTVEWRQEWNSRPLYLISLVTDSSLSFFLLLWFPVFSFFVFSRQVKLSRLCEQDKILQELEATIRTLKEDKVCLLCIYIMNFFLKITFPCSVCICVCVSLSCCAPWGRLVSCLCLSCPYLGQAGVCAGCFPPADGAVQRSARPCWEDCLSAEITTRGCGAHQGWDFQSLHSKKQTSLTSLLCL